MVLKLQRYHKYGALSSNDLWKFAALVFMTVDHIGAYIYPDYLWFRAIGRLSFPIWFFLAGFHSTAHFNKDILIFGILVLVLDIFTLDPVLPLNILFSIICCRLFIQYLERKGAEYVRRNLLVIFIILTVWFAPLELTIEYGAFAFLFALLGLIARYKVEGIWREKSRIFTAIVTLLYIILQCLYFKFSWPQILFVCLGMTIMITAITRYSLHPVSLPVDAPIRLVARYSLQYYFLHKLILQAYAIYLAPEYEFTFKWLDL